MDEEILDKVSKEIVNLISEMDIPIDAKVNLMSNLTHFLADYEDNIRYLNEKSQSRTK